ncbi:MAG: NADH-quinone oxidoreductase subunit J [Verrucomicrobiota bacterium]
MEQAEVMLDLLFYIFSALTVIGALGVIVNKNPVTSAFCLIAAFIGLAALFIQLDAYLVGIIQILVYGGAVMVLFLFIIMLMDLPSEERRKFGWSAVAGGILVGCVFVVQLVRVLGDYSAGSRVMQDLPVGVESDVEQIGKLMFTQYYFPVQVVGVLLLISTIGVIVLSKRELD